MKLTEAQRAMARHALGLTDGRKVSYRNRYVVGIGTTQEAEWNALVQVGGAERGQNGIAVVGFCLTAAGANAALDRGESLDCEDFPAGRAALNGGRSDG